MGNSIFSSGNRLVLPKTLLIRDINLPVASLVGSGAEQNLINSELVEQLNIPIVTLNHPGIVSELTRKTMTTITHRTVPESCHQLD